jgi:quercetin dioxygenase-like cupin family protein
LTLSPLAARDLRQTSGRTSDRAQLCDLLSELELRVAEPGLRRGGTIYPRPAKFGDLDECTRATLWATAGRAQGEDSTMGDEQVAQETRGVTVELLATVDLGPEIEGMEGRQLRMRMVTIEPGGVFGPVHNHEGRPGTVYVLQGTITDHRDRTATDYGPGVGWPEDRNTLHWLENRGTVPAVEISVDVVRQE